MEHHTTAIRHKWERQISECTEEEAFATAHDLTRSGSYEEAIIAYSVLEDVYEERENECLRGLAVAYKAMGNLEYAAIYFAMSENASLLETSVFVPNWWNGA
jgi:thioredoxin-like negative regulator of GroEL